MNETYKVQTVADLDKVDDAPMDFYIRKGRKEDIKYFEDYMKDQIDKLGKSQSTIKFKDTIPVIESTAMPAYDPIIKDMKYDSGKLLAAIPFEDFPLALKEVAKISTYGTIKYSRSSWKTVPNAAVRYKDAKFRHLLEMEINGTSSLDEESKLLHIAHYTWNCLALLELHLSKNEV